MRRRFVHLLNVDDHGDAFAEAALRRFWSLDAPQCLQGPDNRSPDARVVDFVRWARARTESRRA